MPVIQLKKFDDAHILIWEITESEYELIVDLPSTILTDQELEEAKIGQKKKEMLASRLAIRYLAKELNLNFSGIKKDEYGKPYLVDSEWQMSLTHSENYIAVIMHPNKNVGIDIEKPNKKMWRILERLFSENEIRLIGEDLDRMSIFWSAKEALYKLYGKRGTDFRQNLLIDIDSKGYFGKIIMHDCKKEIRIFTEKVQDYILVWAI